MLSLVIADNGCGMSAETITKATNPFYTTRTTRKVGLGLPFLIQNAEQSGGGVSIDSSVGRGTTVIATFHINNIDCPPVGDIAETAMQIIAGNPQIDTTIRFCSENDSFSISTAEISEALGGMPLGYPQVAVLIREMIADNFNAVFSSRLYF